MRVDDLASAGRVLALALVGAFVASSCSALPANLLAVPPTERARDEVPTAPPVAAPSVTPRPRSASETNPHRVEAKLKTMKLKPRPKPGPFDLDLYRKGDFMHQATKDWCVAGSTQTMMNIIDSEPNRSVRFQERLYERGRRLSPNKVKLGPIGVDLTGWKELLNTGGYGPYEVVGAPTLKSAIRKAARALRMTNKPVGLVTWRGAHSWVMSGFTATADPAYDKDFRVKAVYIQDTWYPYVSTIWGASRPPDSLVPVGKLQEDYLPYQRPRARYPRRDGKYMLILPVLPEGTVVR